MHQIAAAAVTVTVSGLPQPGALGRAASSRWRLPPKWPSGNGCAQLGVDGALAKLDACTNVVGIFPSDVSITRLVGVASLE